MNQYEQESKLGLEKTQYMKDLNISRVWYQNESGFMKVIVLPLYEEIYNFYEDEVTKGMLERGRKNLLTW